MLQNWNVANEDGAPCADTGVPRYYIKFGNEARLEGGFIALKEALTLLCLKRCVASQRWPLYVTFFNTLSTPQDRQLIGMLRLQSISPPVQRRLDADYRMLFPGDGIDGIKRFPEP